MQNQPDNNRLTNFMNSDEQINLFDDSMDGNYQNVPPQ